MQLVATEGSSSDTRSQCGTESVVADTAGDDQSHQTTE